MWPNYSHEISARLKSNKKFQCESKSEFIQKARHKDTLVAANGEIIAKDGGKYFLHDGDAGV